MTLNDIQSEPIPKITLRTRHPYERRCGRRKRLREGDTLGGWTRPTDRKTDRQDRQTDRLIRTTDEAGKTDEASVTDETDKTSQDKTK